MGIEMLIALRGTFGKALSASWYMWLIAGLSGCAGVLPLVKPGPEFDPAKATEVMATKWYASSAKVPHNADQKNLLNWWAQLGDPLLLELIQAAQINSATASQASIRLAQARNGLAQVDASALPSLDASGSFSRSAVTFGGPVAIRSQTQAQLLSSWELDLFGARYRESQSAIAKVKARQADWHDARVSLAADIANLYVQYRFCEQQVLVLEADLKSRAETARLTDIAAKAGFQPLSNAAVLRASAADASRRVISQRTECAIAVKSLVALTAFDEDILIGKLADKKAQIPPPVTFSIATVPAAALSQRPDLMAAEFDLASASADIGVAESAKYPRLSLSGGVGPLRLSSGGMSISATTWSIGPSLSLPIFDGGKRQANSQLAKESYIATEQIYRAKARQAIKEVEEALLKVALADQRQADTEIAAKGFKDALIASQSKWQVGIGSLLELEEARRQSLAADVEIGVLARDKLLAWIGLYKAVGGDWNR
jgi:outer membrane protein, multidrug efflux system